MTETRPQLTSYQQDVATYWNNTADLGTDPQNVRLGQVDGYYHHHYGIGEVDTWKLQSADSAAERDNRVIAELHRLEHAQANLLLDNVIAPDLAEGARLLDAGSGRGGTSFMAHEQHGARVDGVSISEYQVDFANAQARERGVDDMVRFHLRNMLDTGFEAGSFDAVWTNETTMYVYLDTLFEEFARLLRPGGRYVCITGARNDVWGPGVSPAVDRINRRYHCDVHTRSFYFRALIDAGFVPVHVEDLTPRTLPYWRLRQQCSIATGVEDDFLEAYEEGSFQYLLIVADHP